MSGAQTLLPHMSSCYIQGQIYLFTFLPAGILNRDLRDTKVAVLLILPQRSLERWVTLV